MSENVVPLRRLLFVAFGSCLIGPSVSAADTPEDLAQKAAESWLKLVDTGRFGDSWAEAAGLFKKAITQAQWEQAARAAVTPLGKLASRKLKTRQYAEKLPNAPDGKYVVIQYDSVFANKASAVETITPMLDADGVWRVSGYYIK
jgi:hypothetical protein